MRPEFVDGKRTLITVSIDKKDHPSLARLDQRITKLAIDPLPTTSAFR